MAASALNESLFGIPRRCILDQAKEVVHLILLDNEGTDFTNNEHFASALFDLEMGDMVSIYEKSILSANVSHVGICLLVVEGGELSLPAFFQVLSYGGVDGIGDAAGGRWGRRRWG